MSQQDPIQRPTSPHRKNEDPVGKQGAQAVRYIVRGIVALSVVLCGSLLTYKIVPGCGEAQREMISIFKKGFVVNKHTISVYTSFIGKMNNEKKLVVSTLTKPVEVSKNDKLLVLGDWISLGETVTKIRVNQCKVQYVISLNSLTENSILFDQTNNMFRASFPKPMADKEMVYIPSNPELQEKETDQGWARFNGKELENEALKELESVLLSEAENDIYEAKVQNDARETLANILNPIINSIVPGAKLEIVFND